MLKANCPMIKKKKAFTPHGYFIWPAIQQRNCARTSFKIYHCPHYWNYCLMINWAAHGYVHKGTAFLWKKQFSLAHGTNYKGVKWFMYAAMQIKKREKMYWAAQGRGLSMQIFPFPSTVSWCIAPKQGKQKQNKTKKHTHTSVRNVTFEKANFFLNKVNS